MAPIVEFRGLAKRYGSNPVLAGVDLVVERGDLAVIYGPPAAGKSVLMRLLMGLEKPGAGTISVRNVDVVRVPAAERNIGYVPQSFALYPHLSVHDNIAYPVKLSGVGKREAQPIVRQAAEMLRITDLLEKRPDQLSGGQKQRVAIARGIAKQTDLFVLDDPLAGLDYKLREQLVDDLKALQQEWGATFLYTTSDPLEALALADTLAVLDDGRVIEHAPPDTLYRRPTRARTMALVGFPGANFVPGTLLGSERDRRCRTAVFEVPVELTADADTAPDQTPVSVGIRPEHLAIVAANGAPDAAGDEGWPRFAARVLLAEDLGGEELVYLDAGGTNLTTVLRQSELARRADLDLTVGDARVTVAVPPEALTLFSTDGVAIGHGARRATAAPVGANHG